MFYFLGSLLFALAMMAALAVMATNFTHYRRAMMTALRGLSMGDFAAAPRQERIVNLSRQAAPAVGSRRAVA